MRTVTLVGFYNDLNKKAVTVGSGVIAFDLFGKPVMLQVNESPLINGNGNSLLSTTQAREKSFKIDDVAKKHGGT